MDGLRRCYGEVVALDGPVFDFSPCSRGAQSNRVCAPASERNRLAVRQSVRTETAGGTDEFRAAPSSALPEVCARLTTANHRLGAESLQSRVPDINTEQKIEV